MGAWIDLDEAKRILKRGIKGDFFHLEMDDEYPSGFRVGTSYEDEKCVFLDKDGLCRVHKVDYALKPVTCKEFPYEGEEVSSMADILCLEYKAMRARNKAKFRGRG
jgi:Fe-S-cluster containining protein